LRARRRPVNQKKPVFCKKAVQKLLLRDNRDAQTPMTHPTGISARSIRLRNTGVFLLVGAGSVNYLDRAALAVGNPEIRHALGLSYGQMGLLLSAFAWSYGLAQIPAGLAVDKFGARRTLGIGMVLWSFAQIGAGFVGSFAQFIVARVALGLGESPMYIGGTRICADWFAAKDRALPIAIFNSSSALAPALAPPLLTVLMLEFGWQAMFIIAGLAGFGVAIAWLIFYRSPVDANIPASDSAIISADDGPDITHIGFAQVLWLLKFPTSWGMFLGFFGVVYIYWLFATWLPGYLETERHLSIHSAGLVSAIPLAAGFFGAVLGGVISGALGRRMDAISACRIPVILGLLAAAIFTIAAAYAQTTWLAVALISAGLFAINISSSCGWALAAVITPPNTVATLEAIQNVGGSLGGSLAPWITGALVGSTGSFFAAFALAGVIAFVAAIFYGIMTRRKIT
jgi:MFS family permease